MARGRTTHNLDTLMKTQITIHLTLAALVGLALNARGDDDPEQAEFPQITAQPTDQGSFEGGTATFSVQATNGAGKIRYQWLRNGDVMEDQTNATLTLDNVTVDDTAMYSCDVAQEDGEAVPTRSASLNVLTSGGGGQIIVYGTPLAKGGTRGTCPGTYAGYVNYGKTVAEGWGWVPTAGTTIHLASDSIRTDTKVTYTGRYLDYGCAQTIVAVPDPALSPTYRFSIFFPNNVPTSPYPITLTGFNP